MSRLPRLYVPGQTQHVILRALPDRPAFRDEADFALYRKIMDGCAHDHNLAVHSYVLLPHEVRMLVTPSDRLSLPKAIQGIGRRYGAAHNFRHERKGAGTVWAGRYHATVIDSEQYFLQASIAMEAMAVFLGLVSTPGEWQWSSYRHNVGLTTESFLTGHAQYWALGNTPHARQWAYRELFEVPLNPKVLADLEHATLRSWAFGGDEFKRRVALTANRRVVQLKRGRPRKLLPAIDPVALSKPEPKYNVTRHVLEDDEDEPTAKRPRNTRDASLQPHA